MANGVTGVDLAYPCFGEIPQPREAAAAQLVALGLVLVNRRLGSDVG